MRKFDMAKRIIPIMFKEYFSLTNNERRGFFVLFLLVIILLVAFKVRQIKFEPESIDLTALEDSVKQFYNSPPLVETPSRSYIKENTTKTRPKTHYTPPKPKQKQEPLVPIEINGASIEKLCEIKGIGEYYAKNIINERERVGGFSDISQLLGAYGMTTEKLSEIKKQIIIDTALCLPKIPLNSADSTNLSKIYGIEPYLAARIINYREKLGGFYDVEQLLEIYGINNKHYHNMLCRIVLDSVKLHCLNINNSDFKTVLKHPYFNYENTKAIFRYLDYGAITSWEEFCKIPNLKLEHREMLKHYLVFEPTANTDSIK